jgi:hypothetical protein
MAERSRSSTTPTCTMGVPNGKGISAPGTVLSWGTRVGGDTDSSRMVVSRLLRAREESVL